MPWRDGRKLNICLMYNSYLGHKPVSKRRKRKTKIEVMKRLEIGSCDLFIATVNVSLRK